VLNTSVPRERAESVSKHMQHILGSSGYVECLVRDNDGTERLVTRRADSQDRITVIDQQNETRVVEAKAGAVFPISILGWHEIESVADRSSARIDVLDRVGDPSVIREALAKIKSNIDRARDQLPLLQRHVRRLDTSLKQLWELQRKRSTLQRLAEGDLSRLQQQYEWFLLTEQRISAIAEAADRRRAEIAEVIASHLDVQFTEPLDSTPLGELSDLLNRMVESGRANKEAESSAIASVDGGLEAMRKSAQAAADALARAFTEFRDSVYTPKVNALPPEDREILSKQIQVLEDTKRLPTIERTCDEQLREMQVLAQELFNLCESICALRAEIVTQRESLIARLNSELPGIKLQFKRAANHEARDRFQNSYGSEGGSIISFVDSLTGSETYDRLRQLFDKLLKMSSDQDKWDVRDTRFSDEMETERWRSRCKSRSAGL